jgi:hypothetical protein
LICFLENISARRATICFFLDQLLDSRTNLALQRVTIASSDKQNKKGRFMSLDKIIWAVAFLAAIVLAFVDISTYNALILAILGLASGYFVKGDHRKALILAAIFLMAGGSMALGSIPAVGAYLNDIFANYGAVLGAASLMVIVMATVERLMPGGE